MAKVYNPAGNSNQSDNVSVTVVNDTIDPTVSVTTPANNATVSGSVNISVNASDNVGVSMVEFYENGALLSASNIAPYNYSWNTTAVANGTYTLSAKAYDAASNIGQSSNVTVTVYNPDTTAPTVSIAAPTNNATVSGTVSVNATASDNLGVSKVEFYVNNVLQATDTASPYTFSWNTTSVTNGSYILSTKAFDAATNIGLSSTVSVTVNNTDITNPSVSITAPAVNTVVSGNFSVTADASDNIGVSKVEFYVNNVLQATDTSSPYTFNWNTTSVANGSYNLSTKAYDAANNVGLSSTISVTVNNTDTTAPTVSVFTIPATATTLTVAINSIAASDNVGVTGYLISESNTPPLPNAAGWTTSAPATYSAVSAGSHTLYPWAKDAAGNVSAVYGSPKTVVITLPTTMTITTSTLPTATVETYFYSYLSASGGVAPYTWTITSGSLPSGITLNAINGGITGTPNIDGTFTFTIQATDSTGTTATKSLTLNAVAAPLAITTTTMPTATVKTYFYSYLAASGGVKPYTWAITSGTLPSGITLNATDGGIKGTPGIDGTFTFTVQATDSKGTKTTKSLSLTVIDPTPPVVSGFALPSTATTLTVSVTTFTAADNVGVTGYLITENSSPPLPGSTGWSSSTPASYAATTDGIHTLYPWAKDAAGNVSAVYGSPITVVITLADTTKPTVSVSTPVNNARVSGTATVIATATDNSSVAKVEFYINGVLYATDTSNTYSYIWNTSSMANGTYTISAKAYDAAGNVGQSANVAVFVSNTPTVSISTPINGSYYNAPATITLNAIATASGNATLTKVEFYNGTVLLGSDSTSPFSFAWSKVPKGTYTLTAKVYDSSGATNVSTPVTVNVFSPVTAVTVTSVSPASPKPVGTSVIFTASASGGSGTYQYQFMVKNPVTGWSIAQTYSTSSSFTWNTTGLPAGTYAIQVWARNSGSTASNEAWKGLKYVLR
jgi:hypothetical protein